MTTTTASTATTVAVPDLSAGSVAIPTGNIVVGADDLFIVHSDGDLWLHPGILDGTVGTPLRLADLVDPRLPTGPEGDGPNQVEDVAGAVDGVVYYSDCCSPIVGDLLAATSADSERIVLGAGYAPALSPDHTKLSTTNSYELVVIDLATGTYEARVLNDDPLSMQPWDVIWTSDSASVLVLYFDSTWRWSLVRFDAKSPFAPGEPVQLGVAFDPTSTDVVRFAGRGPSGEIAVVVGDNTTTTIRYFDAETLIEIPAMQHTLPAGVRSASLADDGVSLLWIDDTATLWYQPAGGEARRLGDGFTAAWFTT